MHMCFVDVILPTVNSVRINFKLNIGQNNIIIRRNMTFDKNLYKNKAVTMFINILLYRMTPGVIIVNLRYFF